MDNLSKKDSIYHALRDTNLPTDTIRIIKSYLSREDWNRKDIDEFSDPFDYKFIKKFKTRHRKRSFTWPFYSI